MNESKDKKDERQFLPPMSELIDRMTVTQIKLALLKNNKESFIEEISKLEHDIDLIIDSNNIKLDSRLIRIIIVLSQMNLHIWQNKDKMQDKLGDNQEKEYLALLKLSHQLNGIRNRMKNALLEIEDVQDKSQIRSNFETDGLDWDINI
jgi:hypothetical protein